MSDCFSLVTVVTTEWEVFAAARRLLTALGAFLLRGFAFEAEGQASAACPKGPRILTDWNVRILSLLKICAGF